jgi:CBS domain-containing protein
MGFVKELLRTKGSQVWCVSPEATVFEALQEMADKNIGALVVLKDDRIVGIFSERDYARKVILKGKSSREIPVSEIMSTSVTTIEPSETLQACMRLMTDHRIRHLPVVNQEQLVGLISIGDVVKGVISEQQFMIAQLEGYISGSR